MHVIQKEQTLRFRLAYNSWQIKGLLSAGFSVFKVRVNSYREHPPPPPQGKPRAFEKIGQMPGPAGSFCWQMPRPPFPLWWPNARPPSPSDQYTMYIVWVEHEQSYGFTVNKVKRLNTPTG